MRRRRIAIAASVLILAVGACSSGTGAPAGEGVSATTETSVTAPPTSAGPSPSSPSDRSPLAEQTRELGSAVYDPAEHQIEEVRPVGLTIPSIDVADAFVAPVGVEPNGEMEIPPPTEVGWYRFGAAPDEAGSIVLAAHIAYDGVDGVFRHLDRLDEGAEVVVGLEDGTSRTYRVTSLGTYPKEDLPAEVFATTGPERLVLITCGGRFDTSRRSYESNVIAVAEPVA